MVGQQHRRSCQPVPRNDQLNPYTGGHTRRRYPPLLQDMPMQTVRRLKLHPGWWLVLPILIVVMGMFLGPILNILWMSVTVPEPGLGNYAAVLESEALRRMLWTTLRVCAITTILSVVLGYSIAYAMMQAAGPSRHWMLSLLLVTFWISVLVRTFSWLMLLGRNGPVNSMLTGAGIVSEPVEFMRNELGVLIGMVHYMIPYAVLPILASMQNIDQRVIAASRSLGAGGVQTFWRIYLPLTRPGIVAGAILVYILSIGFFVTPAILGGGRVLMVAEYISVQVLITLRWGTAAMLAVLLLGGVLALLFVLSRLMPLSQVFGGARR
jgi:putative spermidine/putrescine transport system permease protein